MRYVVAAVVLVLLFVGCNYCLLPVWFYPRLLGWLAFFGIVACVIFFIFDAKTAGKRGYGNTVTLSTWVMCTITVLVLLWMALLGGCGGAVTRSGALRALPDVKVSKEQIEIADTTHIRLVPEESAKWIGNQVLGEGNLGALYEVSRWYLQRYQKKLVWVSPLDFRGFFAWRRAEGVSPGYVIVDAESLNTRPKLVKSWGGNEIRMRYLLSGNFNSRLERYLWYRGYFNKIQHEPTFEIDEEGKPYYVVSMTRPTVGYTGEKLTDIVIVDPQSGEIKPYELGKTPDWADRAFPESLARSYANWWGKYVHGWWNSEVGKKDVQNVTPKPNSSAGKDQEEVDYGYTDVFLVYNQRTTHPIWISGMTSPSMKDASLTGYMTFDSINGEAVFYEVQGFGNEQTAINSVESAPEVAVQKNYHADMPIFYNLYGAESWVVPVLSPSHIVEKIGIVYAPNAQHAVVGRTKEEALRSYKRMLADLKTPGFVPTQDRMSKTATGKVKRPVFIQGAGGTTLYFLLDEVPNQAFQVPVETFHAEAALTREEDRVRVGYQDTGEGDLSVFEFDNLEFKLVVSPPQEQYLTQAEAERSQTQSQLEVKEEDLRRQQQALDREKRQSEE